MLERELEFVKLWKRRVLLSFIQILSQRRPTPYDAIRKIAAKLPGATDRAFFSALPALSTLGLWPLRAYLLSQQAPRERRRILTNKLKRMLML